MRMSGETSARQGRTCVRSRAKLESRDLLECRAEETYRDQSQKPLGARGLSPTRAAADGRSPCPSLAELRFQKLSFPRLTGLVTSSGATCCAGSVTVGPSG